MHIIAPLIVVVLGIAAFANSFQGVFLFDDEGNIVRRGWLYEDDAYSKIFENSSDRPLTDMTFIMNIRAQGATDGSNLDPKEFHAVNLIIHLVGALALFGIVHRTLRLPRFGDRFEKTAVWFAAIIAGIWVVHPLQTQGVTYIVQRAESMMAMFYLLTLYCYIRGATASMHHWIWLAGAVIACAAGMASKSIMVTAPILIALYDYCFLWRDSRQRRIPRLITLLWMMATWYIVFRIGIAQAVLDPTLENAGIGLSYETSQAGRQTWLYYFLSQPAVLLHYLRLSVWPDPLVLDYKWPLVERFGQALVPLCIMVTAGLATIWALFKRPAVGFVAASFFIVLAPTSSFIPIRDVAFEHRMYLPLAAVVSLLVVAVYAAMRALFNRIDAPQNLRLGSAAVASVLVVIALTIVTYNRNLDYHDREDMWRNNLANAPFGRQPRALNNLAAELVKKSKKEENPARKTELDDEACALFAEVIDSDPERFDVPMAEVYYNLGNCARRRRDLDTAVDWYHLANEVNPKMLQPYIMCGNSYADARQHRQAEREYRTAIDAAGQPSKPGRRMLAARASYNLGNSLRAMGRPDEAIDAYQYAADMSPYYHKAYLRIGETHELQRDSAAAMRAYQRLLQLVPGHREATTKLRQLQQEAQRN